MKLPRTCLLAALLASPLALAVGTGPTHPDDPHSTTPRPGADSTLNPIEKPVPRDTDPRIQGNDPDSPPAKQNDDRNLPGMDDGGSQGVRGHDGDAAQGQGEP